MLHYSRRTSNGEVNAGSSPHSTSLIPSVIGNALALALSWKANGSILWAILHTFFGWFYVAYNLIVIRDMF